MEENANFKMCFKNRRYFEYDGAIVCRLFYINQNPLKCDINQYEFDTQSELIILHREMESPLEVEPTK